MTATTPTALLALADRVEKGPLTAELAAKARGVLRHNTIRVSPSKIHKGGWFFENEDGTGCHEGRGWQPYYSDRDRALVAASLRARAHEMGVKNAEG